MSFPKHAHTFFLCTRCIAIHCQKKISILRICFLTIFTRVKLNADFPFLTQNAYFTHIRLKAYLEPRKNPLNGPQTFVSTYPPLLHSNFPHLSFVPFPKLRLLMRRCEAFFPEVAPVFPPVLLRGGSQ